MSPHPRETTPARRDPALTQWIKSPLRDRQAPTVPCDVCGLAPWTYILRFSTSANRLLRERRYCASCAHKEGWL